MANEEEKKDYRIITRDIAGKLNLNETYTFTWLLFKSDYRTAESVFSNKIVTVGNMNISAPKLYYFQVHCQI